MALILIEELLLSHLAYAFVSTTNVAKKNTLLNRKKKNL